jgi:rhodanese-related sulfurtransferase
MKTKVVIQLSVRQEAAALPILLRHSPGIVLPERKYVISQAAAQALRDAGIEFSELGGEANAPDLEGAGAGERVGSPFCSVAYRGV